MLTMRGSTKYRYNRYGVTVSARMVLSKHNHANGDHNHANHAKDSTGKKRPVEMVRSTDREIQETGLPLFLPLRGVVGIVSSPKCARVTVKSPCHRKLSHRVMAGLICRL